VIVGAAAFDKLDADGNGVLNMDDLLAPGAAGAAQRMTNELRDESGLKQKGESRIIA
jgi:hypothetical protein